MMKRGTSLVGAAYMRDVCPGDDQITRRACMETCRDQIAALFSF